MSNQPKLNESDYYLPRDIVAATAREGREIPIDRAYDPKLFWDALGEGYFKTYNHMAKLRANVDWILDRIKVLKPKNFIEIGCGFGRIATFLLDSGLVDKYEGVDISPAVMKSSEEYLAPHIPTDEEKKKPDYKPPVDFRSKINFTEGDARKLNVESNSYECVLTHELLQHLNPEDSKEALRELIRISSKYIILIERWGFPGEHSEPHLWSYNYTQLAGELGVDVLQAMMVNNGMQGVVLKKKVM